VSLRIVLGHCARYVPEIDPDSFFPGLKIIQGGKHSRECRSDNARLVELEINLLSGFRSQDHSDPTDHIAFSTHDCSLHVFQFEGDSGGDPGTPSPADHQVARGCGYSFDAIHATTLGTRDAPRIAARHYSPISISAKHDSPAKDSPKRPPSSL